MPAEQPEFGMLLRQFRVGAGLTQEELAERSGLSVRGISDLERGARQHPRRDTLELLNDALGLSLDDRERLIAAARWQRPTRDAGTLATRINNVPRPMTSLVGREQDIDAVCALLRKAEVRLLTLSGPGGVGKTRLAIQVATQLERDFPNGVLFVSLAPLREPGLVSYTVAHAAGIADAGGDPVERRLISFFAPRRSLLLLDNFEHLLPASTLLSELLSSCPDLTILVTSRALLQLSIERVYDVPPLALPHDADLADLLAFQQVPAVALFLERRAAFGTQAEVARQDMGAVVQICRRLDGLPLALELAAARGRYFGLSELAQRLTTGLGLLTDGPLDLPDRQRALRDTIAWSYDLLSAVERRLFRWLTVFRGGWTATMAEELTRSWSDAGILPALAGLVDSSLVRLVPRLSGHNRFEMLETIREFAEAELTASGETGEARRHHAVLMTDFTVEAERGLQSGARTAWSRRCVDELDNVRAALRWSIDSGATDLALRIAGNLDWFWDAVGRDREGWGWTLDVLSLPGVQQSGRDFARSLNTAGALAWNMGEFERSAELLGRSVELLRHLDDPRSLGQALMNLGLTLHYQGRSTALDTLRESVAQFEQVDDPWCLAMARYLVAELLSAVDPRSARHYYEESLALFRRLNEPWGIAHALSGLGGLAMHQQGFDEAQALFVEALELRRTIGNPHAIATSLTSLGELARLRGQTDRAEAYLTDALARFRNLGDSEHVAWTIYNIGMTALQREDAATAAKALAECLELRVAQGNQTEIAQVLSGIAEVTVLRGNAEDAARLWGAAEQTRADGALEREPETETLAQIRALLGENLAHDLVNAGRSLATSEAIELARGLVCR